MKLIVAVSTLAFFASGCSAGTRMCEIDSEQAVHLAQEIVPAHMKIRSRVVVRSSDSSRVVVTFPDGSEQSYELSNVDEKQKAEWRGLLDLLRTSSRNETCVFFFDSTPAEWGALAGIRGYVAIGANRLLAGVLIKKN